MAIRRPCKAPALLCLLFVLAAQACAQPAASQEPLPLVGRQGPVRLDGRAFSDAGGTWNAFGTSLFWALWAERNDPDKLDRNLSMFARGGGDYVRVFSMVGGRSWEDRTVDPKSPDYWVFVDRLAARAARHGLRLQITIFAAAQDLMPSRLERERWIDLWAARMNKEPARFIVAEIANEYWQNGIASAAELRDLTARLNRQTEVLVAPSATQCGSMPGGTDERWRKEEGEGAIDHAERTRRLECRGEWLTIYGTGAADLALPHFDREVGRAEGPDQPIHQPWQMILQPRELIQSYVNNEPIGPQSSGASDTDPQRLAMAAATTWLAGGAAYTLHTGAGIRGGGACAGCAPQYKSRSSNLWELPNITETLRRIAAVRSVIPPGLANCQPHNASSDFPNRVFDTDPKTLVRAFHSTCPGGVFVALPHGIRGQSARLVPRQDIEVDGRIIPAGQALTVSAPSAVIVGRVR